MKRSSQSVPLDKLPAALVEKNRVALEAAGFQMTPALSGALIGVDYAKKGDVQVIAMVSVSGKTIVAAKPRASITGPDGVVYRSKLERDWHALRLTSAPPPRHLEYEPIKLKLGRGAYYTPDFVEWSDSGDPRPICWEIKGPFFREAARVRIKVAASKFPRMRFIVVRRKPKKEGGDWYEEEIRP